MCIRKGAFLRHGRDVYKRQVIVCGQALGCGLTESFAAGGKIDGMEPLAGFVADMLPALVQGIGLHYRAPPAAIAVSYTHLAQQRRQRRADLPLR